MIKEYSHSKNYLYILVSLMIAMSLSIIPLPSDLTWARPLWVFMVIIYWMISLPYSIGLGTAWAMGLLLDLLTGTLLGMHALLFVVIAFCVLKWEIHRSAPLWQQILLLLVMVTLYLVIQYWLMAIAGMIVVFSWRYIWPAITTLLFWPILFFFLRWYQLKFRLI